MINENTSISRADRTATAILDSAYQLFIKQGYAATSMREIANAAGLALGGIYNHFPSKEDIFTTIILERHPIFEILPQLDHVNGDNMDEFVRNVARAMVNELGQHPEFINLFLIELVEFKGIHAPLLIKKIYPAITNIALRMKPFEESLRPIHPALMVRIFIGLFASYFITELLFKNLLPPEANEHALDNIVDVFLNGIKKIDSQEATSSAQDPKT